MNADEFELLKEKMFTKITQLTRVVYLLNNKYLDSQNVLECLKQSYEDEIDNVVREANIAITSLQSEIKKLHSSNEFEDKLASITNKYADKFNSLRTEFENYKRI